MSINWDVIRRRGEEGLLTADEAGALVDLAQTNRRRYDLRKVSWMQKGALHCLYCDAIAEPGLCTHADDCPIAILEAASDGADQ